MPSEFYRVIFMMLSDTLVANVQGKYCVKTAGNIMM